MPRGPCDRKRPRWKWRALQDSKLAISGFVAGRNGAIGGSGKPLPSFVLSKFATWGNPRKPRAGKEVLLTERGQPIAVIKPIKDSREPAAVLKRMADEGLVTLPTRKGPLPRFEPARLGGKPLSQTIIEDRDDRA